MKLFWDRVDKTDKCWLWKGARSNQYGSFRFNRKPTPAHRVAWTLTHGEIPEKMYVLHKCDTPPCVNPNHLFLGSKLDNCHDMMRKKRNRWNAHPNGEKPRAYPKAPAVEILKVLQRKMVDENLTQEFVAREVGVSWITVHRWMNGHTKTIQRVVEMSIRRFLRRRKK